jgi:hypothetical protein
VLAGLPGLPVRPIGADCLAGRSFVRPQGAPLVRGRYVRARTGAALMPLPAAARVRGWTTHCPPGCQWTWNATSDGPGRDLVSLARLVSIGAGRLSGLHDVGEALAKAGRQRGLPRLADRLDPADARRCLDRSGLLGSPAHGLRRPHRSPEAERRASRLPSSRPSAQRTSACAPQPASGCGKGSRSRAPAPGPARWHKPRTSGPPAAGSAGHRTARSGRRRAHFPGWAQVPGSWSGDVVLLPA